MDLQMTQVVNEDRVNEDNDNDTQVGTLRVGSTEHSIFKGFTKIGRSPALCKIVVDDLSVSKVHAEIQAECDIAFVSDLRSSNGTRIKEAILKPFHYYTINDGDEIYFGTVKATFTTVKSSNRRVETLPETSIPSTRLNEKNRSSIANASECLFLQNNSSVCQSDVSAIPCTQQTPKQTNNFQQPSNPKKITNSSTSSIFKRSNKRGNEKTIVRNLTESTDIHELETQQFDDSSFVVNETPAKISRLSKFNDASVDSNIHEAETQILSQQNENVRATGARKIPKNVTNEIKKLSDSENLTHENSRKTENPRSSASPPNSPNVDLPDDEFNESQNLLELCEAPLLEHAKKSNDENLPIDECQTVSDVKKIRENPLGKLAKDESTLNQSKTSHRVIAESDDDSTTDDDMEIAVASRGNNEKIVKKNASTSDLIEDDSATDEEGNFEDLAMKSKSDCEQTLQRKSSLNNRDVDDDVHEAATQIVDQRRVDRVATKNSIGAPETIHDDTDIDLLPTQILDVPTSTPNSKLSIANFRKSGKKQFHENDDELHLAATQIANEVADVVPREASKVSTVVAVDSEKDDSNPRPRMSRVNVPTSTPNSKLSIANVRKSGKKQFHENDDELHLAATQIVNEVENVVRREASKVSTVVVIDSKNDSSNANDDNRESANLDDSLAKNLGLILNQEANNVALTGNDDVEQMMTQNLVDILTPSQNCRETKLDDDDDGEKSLLAGTRRRSSLVETLGFVGGRPVTGDERSVKDNGDEEKSLIGVGRNNELDLDDDDILAGLPEVKISGTLSNPGSPCSSIASSGSDVLSPDSRKSDKSTKIASSPVARKIPIPGKSIVENVENSSIHNSSAIVEKKSKIIGRRGARKIIDADENDDSDDTFGYNDLKKLADNLLTVEPSANSSRKSFANDRTTKVHETTETKSTTTRESRSRRVENVISTKNNEANLNPRIRKLSESPTSLIVADSRIKRRRGGGNVSKSSRVIDSSSSSFVSGTKNSLDSEGSKKLGASRSKTMKTEQSEESQEVETIVGVGSSRDDAKRLARTSCVRLKRLGDFDVAIKSDKVDDDDSSSMGQRKRRATVCAKDVKTEPVTPVATRNRKTMNDAVKSPKVSRETHRILITGPDQDDYAKMVKKLGGTVIAEPSKATVLISDQVRRTKKFLCAVGLGLPVVSKNWLTESQKAGRFLDCDDFILDDPKAEKRWRFELAKSLKMARTKKCFDGYVVVVTPKVNEPAISELRGMFEACGGKILTRAPGPRAWNAKTVIVSQDDDLTAINALLSKCPKSVGVTVQTKEFILTGILRQEVNFVEHKLDIS